MSMSTGSVNQLGQVMRRAAIEARYQTTRELDRVTAGLEGEDRLEISQGARELEGLRGRLLEQAMAMPDVRQDRVAQVRARVAEGYYQREDLVSEVANRLMADKALAQVDDSQATPPSDPAYREDLMREVDAKIHSGFYTDGEVMNFVADRLLSIYEINPNEDKE
jgi:hypothetical protein